MRAEIKDTHFEQDFTLHSKKIMQLNKQTGAAVPGSVAEVVRTTLSTSTNCLRGSNSGFKCRFLHPLKVLLLIKTTGPFYPFFTDFFLFQICVYLVSNPKPSAW